MYETHQRKDESRSCRVPRRRRTKEIEEQRRRRIESVNERKRRTWWRSNEERSEKRGGGGGGGVGGGGGKGGGLGSTRRRNRGRPIEGSRSRGPFGFGSDRRRREVDERDALLSLSSVYRGAAVAGSVFGREGEEAEE
ncbi:unnamed protein product [Calypogeia fissa]